MKAKLIKQGDRYVLYAEGGHKVACTSDSPYKKLSLKNCQAIERGYDLDELADEYCTHKPKNAKELRDVNLVKLGFRDGFQKALEILGDRKFTEEDLRKAYFHGEKDSYVKGGQTKQMENEFIQSLQQNEWECIILIDEKTNKPLLDANGCLILKRS